MKIGAHKSIAVLVTIQIFFAFGAGWLAAAPGDLDTTFGTGGRVIYAPTSDYDFVRRVSIQPDGRL